MEEKSGTEESLEDKSRTELQARSRQLDGRVKQLHHAIIAARYNNDQAALEKAEEELKTVNKDRVDVLRALGDMP